MKTIITPPSPSGAALAETVISVGLLALAVPVVMAAFGESGKSNLQSAAESSCGAMISRCLDELRASRRGVACEFPASFIGQPFPPEGEIWVLGFTSSGALIGRISMESYQTGRHLESTIPAYIVRCSASALVATDDSPTPPTSPLFETRLALEYPASLPAEKRQSIEFFTRLP